VGPEPYCPGDGQLRTPGAAWIFSSNRGKSLDRSPRRPAGRFLEAAGTSGNAVRAHGHGGHQLDHILARALRTFGRGILRRQNQIFKTVATAFTLIFIDRHCFFLLQKKYPYRRIQAISQAQDATRVFRANMEFPKVISNIFLLIITEICSYNLILSWMSPLVCKNLHKTCGILKGLNGKNYQCTSNVKTRGTKV